MSSRLLCGAVGLILLGSGGCTRVRLCNGTGEPLEFVASYEYVTGEPREREAMIVGPCVCKELFIPSSIYRRHDAVEINDVAGNDVAHTNGLFFGDDSFVTFDGFQTYVSVVQPDLTIKHRITFRDASSAAVHMRPQRVSIGDPGEDYTDPVTVTFPARGPYTLLEPGESRDLLTIRGGSADFEVRSDSSFQFLATCTAEIVDGLEIVWDGENLNCGVAPPATDVDVDLCNEDIRPGAFPVILVTAEEDVLPEKNVLSGECRTVSIPTGASIRFEAWDSEAVLLLDECTLQDPSSGDRVVWDGVALTCVDAPSVSSAAALESPPASDPFEEATAETVRIGRDLLRTVRRYVGRLRDGGIPF